MDYYPSGTEKDGFAWFWAPGPTLDTFTLHKNSGVARETFTREELKTTVKAVTLEYQNNRSSSGIVRSGQWLRMYREGLRHLFNEVAP